MIRGLKILLLAMMTMAAFGALSAPGALAGEFHCAVEPCQVTLKPDGTGKSSHHVFIVRREGESLSTTCSAISGEGVSFSDTASEVTITNITYSTCNVAGEAALVLMNGCDYRFSWTGGVSIYCPKEAEIEIYVPATECRIRVYPQSLLGSVKYTTAGKEITAEPSVKEIRGFIGNNCFLPPGEFFQGEYTTGNTLAAGETLGGISANVWWE